MIHCCCSIYACQAITYTLILSQLNYLIVAVQLHEISSSTQLIHDYKLASRVQQVKIQLAISLLLLLRDEDTKQIILEYEHNQTHPQQRCLHSAKVHYRVYNRANLYSPPGLGLPCIHDTDSNARRVITDVRTW